MKIVLLLPLLCGAAAAVYYVMKATIKRKETMALQYMDALLMHSPSKFFLIDTSTRVLAVLQKILEDYKENKGPMNTFEMGAGRYLFTTIMSAKSIEEIFQEIDIGIFKNSRVHPVIEEITLKVFATTQVRDHVLALLEKDFQNIRVFGSEQDIDSFKEKLKNPFLRRAELYSHFSPRLEKKVHM